MDSTPTTIERTPPADTTKAPTGATKHARGFGGIYQRGEVWWIRYWQDGQERRESSKSTKRKAAEDLLKDRIKQRENGVVNPTAEAKVTVRQLFDALERDYELNGRRSLRVVKSHLANLSRMFGKDRARAVTTRRIEEYKAERRTVDKVTPATVNRELAVLRRAFKLAVQRGEVSLSRVPHFGLLREANARQGFVNPGDFETIVAALPDYLQDVARFAYATGWRKGEIFTLGWADVDRDHQRIVLRPEHSKNAETRVIPYGAVPGLAALIERRWKARQHGALLASTVFHHAGRQIVDCDRAWSRATTAAGMPGLLFHDLRRSAVRNMDRANVSRHVAMKITGHKTESMYRRYRIVDEQEIAAALAQTEAATGTAQAQARTVIPLRAAAASGTP